MVLPPVWRRASLICSRLTRGRALTAASTGPPRALPRHRRRERRRGAAKRREAAPAALALYQAGHLQLPDCPEDRPPPKPQPGRDRTTRERALGRGGEDPGQRFLRGRATILASRAGRGQVPRASMARSAPGGVGGKRARPGGEGPPFMKKRWLALGRSPESPPGRVAQVAPADQRATQASRARASRG